MSSGLFFLFVGLVCVLFAHHSSYSSYSLLALRFRYVHTYIAHLYRATTFLVLD